MILSQLLRGSQAQISRKFGGILIRKCFNDWKIWRFLPKNGHDASETPIPRKILLSKDLSRKALPRPAPPLPPARSRAKTRSITVATAKYEPRGTGKNRMPTSTPAAIPTPFILFTLVLAIVPGCQNREQAVQRELTVFTAASTVDVVEVIGRDFTAQTGIVVRVAGGPSGVLAHQISSGARCDVFVSAHPRYTERLQQEKSNSGTLISLASNELVWVTAADRATDTSLENRLGIAGRIAVANPDHAPAGRYARDALQAVNYWEPLKDRIVYGNDARLTAQYVADGLVDLGVIYRSDATAFGDRIVILEALAMPSDQTIRYQGLAFGCDGNDAIAEDFLAYLASSSSAEQWRRAGFRPLAAH